MTDIESAQIHLAIGYPDFPPVKEVGRILNHLGDGYARYTRQEHGIRNNLSVEHIAIGSLFAVLKNTVELGGAALTAYEHREILAGFVDQIALSIAALREGDPSFRLPSYLRYLIPALAKPVAEGRASYVSISAEFNDRGRVTLETSGAREALKGLEMILATMAAQPAKAGVESSTPSYNGLTVPAIVRHDDEYSFAELEDTGKWLPLSGRFPRYDRDGERIHGYAAINDKGADHFVFVRFDEE